MEPEMEALCENDNKIVLFASVPDQNDLCCIVVQINPCEKHDNSAKSNFHWQILKCRQIIFSEPEIIASPVAGAENQIYIIMNNEFKESGKIQVQLEKVKLTVYEYTSLTNSIYEACLRYTIIARIAPLWNQVESYLIQGRDFLSVTSSLNAIKLDIGINEGEMFVVLWPTRVRLPMLKLQDLDVPAQVSQDFITQSTDFIPEASLGSQWIHVLPSLKRGRLISVSHQIPDNCPFRTYKELKRHWKNLYGYRLPDDLDNIVYYTLFFSPLSPNFYTYPDLCVRSQNLVFLRRVDQLGVLKAFLSDLTKKLPTVCGHPFGINPKIAYAVPKLQNVNEDLARANICNSPNMKSKNMILIEPMFLSSSPINASHMEKKTNTVPSQADIFASQSGQSSSLCSRNISFMTPSESAIAPITVNENNRNNMPPILEGSTPTYLQYSLLCRHTNALNSDAGKTRARYIPVFKRKYLEPHSTSFSNEHSQSEIPSSSITQNDEESQNGKDLQSGFDNVGLHDVGIPNIKCVTSTSPHVYKSMSPAVPPMKLKIVSCNLPLIREINLKREGECSTTTDKGAATKKPRTRPQVQTDVDVEELARNNDLARVNTTTLVNWLREKLVPCKVKDKKSDLVEKVMTYLNLSK